MSFFIPTGSGAGAFSCCTAVKAVSQQPSGLRRPRDILHGLQRYMHE
ncbi:hypothetical protein HMPREF1548_03623 [Clostridium sp. KLE 1755]|nr:hypothetical protein HMPREF1548_03623 [Clostridium sp. KLE 1755]